MGQHSSRPDRAGRSQRQAPPLPPLPNDPATSTDTATSTSTTARLPRTITPRPLSGLFGNLRHRHPFDIDPDTLPRQVADDDPPDPDFNSSSVQVAAEVPQAVAPPTFARARASRRLSRARDSISSLTNLWHRHSTVPSDYDSSQSLYDRSAASHSEPPRSGPSVLEAMRSTAHSDESPARRAADESSSTPLLDALRSALFSENSAARRAVNRRSAANDTSDMPLLDSLHSAFFRSEGSTARRAANDGPLTAPDATPSRDPDEEQTFRRSSRGLSRSTTSTSMANRISSLTPDRGFRSLVRRRRTAPQTEDNAAVLARMLAVAAAATAATLMGGNSEEAVHNLRTNSTGIDGDDGTFDRFLQMLRSGRLAQRLGAHALEQSRGTAEPDGMAFFRVFRFTQPPRSNVNASHDRDTTQSSRSHGRSAGNMVSNDEQDDQTPTDDAMVPVLMIGIRSLPDSPPADGMDAMPSFLDALTSFPSVNMGSEPHDDEPHVPLTDLRSSHRPSRRRTSFNLFPNSLGSRRQTSTGSSPESSRPLSEVGTTGTSTPMMPYPPPTTPSSRPLSALSSGTSTPSQPLPAPSSLSSTPPAGQNATQRSREQHRQSARTALESTAEESAPSVTMPPATATSTSRPPRARRLSESDFMRYGSGSSRRNGVVEPDNNGGNRSWIIYVLGGSYPANHPILLAPSLFTDSPTYEDMMMLSSMLGPVKPPVASSDDVASAGGLVRFEVQGDDVYAVEGGQRTLLAPTEQCLVCLCAYEATEIGRRLTGCSHLFHQECIDQWLMTGRNSCPLCRRPGVEEKAPSGPQASGDSSSSSIRPPSPATSNYIRTPDGR